ncbi:GNAT family N-acetyltransferase [Solitalea canadensis]|uniref:Putative acetyltransferase n=1 Tax=Solitalea canadensis (strain ATCC 29591 / DSM 3403 / JCM 21819 / LMG 8368 / NBRC 15130 / NCIMB 12057 / USAM 9D) TaxID=929556 RepID=H8KSQ6_SOLCM|nr:GNAT family N-acetyltransferase [Solitalea canadensis]AFD05200.1 putative acetyltransferase [Solitalea canadensis DSM 3403]
MDTEAFEVINNERNQQFEIWLNGDVSTLTYRFYKKDIAFLHTKVAESMEGKGVGSALARYAFAYALEHKLPVMVYCPFVSGFIKKHPEFNKQLDPTYHKTAS